MNPAVRPVVDFWYEFASTYSFIAAERIEALARSRNVAVRWRPFLLGPVFRTQGFESSPFLVQPLKLRYMWRDIERLCEGLGVPLARPDPFPQNGLKAARIAIALPDDARPDFTRAVYRLEFCEGRRIDDDDVLAEAVRLAGCDLEPALAAAQTPLVKDLLRRQTEEAMQLGFFGAPNLVTPDGEHFWGNDRLEQALDWAVSRIPARLPGTSR